MKHHLLSHSSFYLPDYLNSWMQLVYLSGNIQHQLSTRTLWRSFSLITKLAIYFIFNVTIKGSIEMVEFFSFRISKLDHAIRC
jgi:hypothetical protein